MFLIAKRHQNGDPRDLKKWCITNLMAWQKHQRAKSVSALLFYARVYIPKILVLRNILRIDISVQMRGCEKEGWVRRWLLVARAGPTGDWPLRSAINSLTSTLTTAQPLSFLLQMVPFTLRLELLLKAVRRR